MNLVSGYSGRICVELSNDCEGGGRQIRVRTAMPGLVWVLAGFKSKPWSTITIRVSQTSTFPIQSIFLLQFHQLQDPPEV
jgi:hypothetical protein